MDCEYVQRQDNNLAEFRIKTVHSGDIRGVIRGDLDVRTGCKETRCVLLTIHDVGTNHQSLEDLILNHEFSVIKKKAVFIHVDLPGQEDHAAKLQDKFPSFQRLAEDLVVILDNFKVDYVVALGVGAGANIASRFAIVHPGRCRGLILINPFAMCAPFFGGSGLNNRQRKANENRDIPEENVKKYLDRFNGRSDISHALKTALKCDVLVITGAKSKMNENLQEEFYSIFGSSPRLSHVNVHGCDHVEVEKPGKVAEAVLLFVQGLGLLSSVPLVSCNRFFDFPTNKV